jgi:hypothetical protein
MNVIVDVRGMNVNPTLLTNQQPVSCTCLAPKARNFNASLGQRPRSHGTQRKAPALKARVSSVRSFQFHTHWLLCKQNVR